MPSIAVDRFLPASSLLLPKLINISEELFNEIPILDDSRPIINSSPTVNLIYRIFCPFLLFVGTCGSIMSLKCLYAQRFRKNNSTYIFFFFIALTDLAILYTGALRLLVMAYTGLDVRSTSLFVCRIHRFTTYFLLQFSSALLALMTFDRARKTLSMLPPLRKTIVNLQRTQAFTASSNERFRTRAKQSKILWATCFVILCLIAVNSHFFYCTGYQNYQNKDKVVCQTVADNLHCRRYWLIYLWVDAFAYSYIPFGIITICNLRLIFYLKEQRRRRLAMTSTNLHLSHNHRITCSVIFMSIIFLCLAVPVAFLEQLEFILKNFKYFYHCLAITYLGMYLNHTISFFLFLFGTQFRESVKELIWAQATERPRSDTTLIALVQR